MNTPAAAQAAEPARTEGPRPNLIERHPWWVLCACLAASALISIALGQDASWDLKNYHLYNAWAWLHGRMDTDLAPAGMQSFFNPLLDVPFYFMSMTRMGHLPRLVAAVQGLYYGGVVFTVWKIAATIARAGARRMDRADACAVFLGVTGAALGPQIGATFNEMPLALLVLVAFWLGLRACTASGETPATGGRPACAGALAGLAAGLKPTAIIYVPALGLAIMAACRGKRPVSSGAAFFLAAGAGFLLAYGYWGWTLYTLTGNPVFPLFNGVFASGWTGTASGMDLRFMPKGPWQWMFYPFDWAFHRVQDVTEGGMSDPRLAFAYLGVLVLGLAGLRPRTRSRRDPATTLLVVFLVLGYVAWLRLFSIFRYTIPLEALSGFVIVAALRRLPATGGRPRAGPAWPVRWGAPLLVLLAVGLTHYPRWQRTPYAAQVFQVDLPQLPDHALVVFAGQPSAYLAPFFHGRDLAFMGITWFTRVSRGHALWTRAQARLDGHRGPIFAVVRDDSGPDLDILRRMHMEIRPGSCRPVHSNLERDRRGRDVSRGLRLCRLQRVDTRQ